MSIRLVSRRNMVRSAGAGIAAALAAQGSEAAQAKPALWSSEYTAKKGSVSLAMYRKRMGAPKSGELTVPGEEYSLMNVFARYGYDVWTMDHENYGKSSRTSGNSDIASGAEDLKAGIELVARETGQQKVHLFGESSGALRVGVYAMHHPESIDRLVLAAFTYKGEGSPTLTERAKQLDSYRAHNTRLRDRAMIRSIFTRDKPGTSDPKLAEILADAELKFGDQVPTGTYLDMTANLPVVDPTRVLAPVLMLRGEYDGIATVKDIGEFFMALPNGDRQFVILPGSAHSLAFAINRRPFWHAMQAFLTMPKAVAITT